MKNTYVEKILKGKLWELEKEEESSARKIRYMEADLKLENEILSSIREKMKEIKKHLQENKGDK